MSNTEQKKIPNAREALAESMKVVEKTEEFAMIAVLISDAIALGKTFVHIAYRRLSDGMDTYLSAAGYCVNSRASDCIISWKDPIRLHICQHSA